MWILSFDHVFTSHNIFVNSKRTYTSARDSQGAPTDYIFQIEGLTQMHDYDDDFLYKMLYYWLLVYSTDIYDEDGVGGPPYRGEGRKI